MQESRLLQPQQLAKADRGESSRRRRSRRLRQAAGVGGERPLIYRCHLDVYVASTAPKRLLVTCHCEEALLQ